MIIVWTKYRDPTVYGNRKNDLITKIADDDNRIKADGFWLTYSRYHQWVDQLRTA